MKRNAASASKAATKRKAAAAETAPAEEERPTRRRVNARKPATAEGTRTRAAKAVAEVAPSKSRAAKRPSSTDKRPQSAERRPKSTERRPTAKRQKIDVQKEDKEDEFHIPESDVFMMGVNVFGQCGQGTGDDIADGEDGVGNIFVPTLVPNGNRPPQVQDIRLAGDATFILADGRIFSFGSNDNGILGRNTWDKTAADFHSEEQADVPVDFEDEDIRIAKIAPGDNHVLALDTQGQLWQWGTFRDGMLGINYTESSDEPIMKKPVRAFSGQAPQKFTDIASLSAHCFAIAEVAGACTNTMQDGALYSWGVFDHFLKFETMAVKKGSERDLRNSLKPSLMKDYFPGGRGKRARRIWAGESNVFVETSDFQIWSWGLNMDHQMGLTGRQKTAERIYKPEKNTPMTTLNGRGAGAPLIQSISSGKFHSIVLMKNGELYACGLNSSGQCGTRRSDTNREPELVKVSIEPLVAASAGTDHTLALARSGHLYGWGFNSCGQLGFDPKFGGDAIDTPQQVPKETKPNNFLQLIHKIPLEGASADSSVLVIAAGANFSGLVISRKSVSNKNPIQTPTVPLPDEIDEEEGDDESADDEFKTGEVVVHNGVECMVKYVGPIQDKQGEWIGLELPTPTGRNNGTHQGLVYFTVKENCGLFVRPNTLQKLRNVGKDKASAAALGLDLPPPNFPAPAPKAAPLSPFEVPKATDVFSIPPKVPPKVPSIFSSPSKTGAAGGVAAALSPGGFHPPVAPALGQSTGAPALGFQPKGFVPPAGGGFVPASGTGFVPPAGAGFVAPGGATSFGKTAATTAGGWKPPVTTGASKGFVPTATTAATTPAPAPAAAAVPATPGGDWKCLACEASNPDSKNFCDGCFSPRHDVKTNKSPIVWGKGAAASPAAAPATPAGDWKCLSCEAKNPDSKNFCDACFSPRLDVKTNKSPILWATSPKPT